MRLNQTPSLASLPDQITAKSSHDLSEVKVPDKVLYTSLWIAPKTGNVGFICATEMLVPTRSAVKRVVKEYRDGMWQHWRLKPVEGSVLRLKFPQDKPKYPLFQIDNGVYVLPFAATEGPMFDEQIKLREAANQTNT